MKKIITMFLALLMLAMSSVAFAATDITSGVIEAEGMGRLGQPVSAGYRAAVVDAYRNLLEEAQGVQVTAESTVENYMLADDVINAKVQGVLKGAHVVKRWKDADGYHVIVRVGLYGTSGLADAVVPNVQQVPLPAPSIFQTSTTSTTTTTVSTRGGYTGLIVDCTGMGLSTAMAPGIYAENNSIVYGLEHFSHEQVINRGYVGYSNGMVNTSRAGAHPLIVKAVALRDNNIRPVITNEDAARILSENSVTGFLNSGNVVFVK